MRIRRHVCASLAIIALAVGGLTACGPVEETGELTAVTPATAVDLDGTVYGDGVTLAESLPISELHDRAEELVGQRVRVEGLVTGVCAKRGCWFDMASDREFEDLQFKVVDGVMVFPMEMTGKYAVAEGVVKRVPLDLDTTRRVLAHRAEEQGDDFDPESVTEAITLVRLDGLGAVVRDAK